MRGILQSSLAGLAFAAVCRSDKTEKNDLSITEQEQNFANKIKERVSEIHEAIKELGIPNNPPYCSFDTTRTFKTEIEELVFKARVALLPILLEAVKGNKDCMEAYAYLRPHLGNSIPEVLCEFSRSISHAELNWTETFIVDVSKVFKESDSKHKKIEDKNTPKKVDYTDYIDFSWIHTSRLGTLFDYSGPMTADVVSEESKDKKGKVIITTPFCAIYPEILCAAVLDDLSLWTSDQLIFELQSLYSKPVDRTPSIDPFYLLPNSLKNMTALSDQFKEDHRKEKITAWSFINDPAFIEFLEAERQATKFCMEKALGSEVRKGALERYLKNLNLDSMNLYLEGKAQAESLTTVRSPTLPKADRIEAKVETSKHQDTTSQKIDVPQSLISALKARFPKVKDKEIQKAGRKIVADSLRYNTTHDEILELVSVLSASSLKELENGIHKCISGNGKPQPILDAPSSNGLSTSIDDVIRNLVSYLQASPENKADRSKLEGEIPESHRAKTDIILNKMLDDGLIMPFEDEYLLNPGLLI